VPHGNWKTVTFIAALCHDRVTAPIVLEGPMTGEMFKAYTEQCLAPTLKKGDIVFMDNVSVHKVDGIEEAIEVRRPHLHRPARFPRSGPRNPQATAWYSDRPLGRPPLGLEPDVVISDLISAIERPEMHYEAIFGHLEVQFQRQRVSPQEYQS
jgi:transposase